MEFLFGGVDPPRRDEFSLAYPRSANRDDRCMPVCVCSECAQIEEEIELIARTRWGCYCTCAILLDESWNIR